jgi:heme/copper-type cytochrome/quinol oxidase subunit 3
MSSEQRVLDVSGLEVGTADSRALLWWGNLAMLAIEGSMFMMTIASFLYLRMANLDWPPSTVPNPDLVLPTVNLALMLLIAIAAFVTDRAALRDEVPVAMLGQAVCILAAIAILVIRFLIMKDIGFKWSSHAYGSVVWFAVGLHTFHVLAALAETALLFVYSCFKPVIKKHLLDYRSVAVYWYFVVLMWIPFYVLIFLQPWMTRKGY